ncbi:MAG: carbamoyltransferase C-terminal domain-containing protein [Myxococcota bacterium]
MRQGLLVGAGLALIAGLCAGVPGWGSAIGLVLVGAWLVAARGGREVAVVGPTVLGRALAGVVRAVARPIVTSRAAGMGLVDVSDPAWTALLARVARRLEDGRTVTVLGITTGTHEAGVAVVTADSRGVRLVANLEEERFSRVKHEHRFPAAALAEALRRVDDPSTVEVVGSWDWVAFAVEWAAHVAEGLPRNLPNVLRPADGHIDVASITEAPRRLSGALGRPVRPVVGLRHHDNHAWGAYALSPFMATGEDTLVLVVDGMGDDGAASAWLASGRSMRRLALDTSFVDSLGLLYQAISAGQGGWTPLSSEGRFMGASAWGDRNRLTNRVYRELRGLLVLGANGSVLLNRAAGNWHSDRTEPYVGLAAEALTPPVPVEDRWNPDAVLDPDRVEHAKLTRARLDEAAALQMLFEDALVHLVDHLVRETRASRLVWTGGAALNCVASLHLLESFDTGWFARNLEMDAYLRLWVPPVPADAGVAAGAALQVLREAGGPVEPLKHAFLGGQAPSAADVQRALELPGVASLALGSDVHAIADRLAGLVARGGVLGLFHGAAETGPRALGHRSIVADPTNPDVLALINDRVKRRERIRPLAPMCTRAAAEALFELQPGAADGDYAAYDFMVQCVRAKDVAREKVPAVVHRDGTARLQIVRPDVDPLTFAFLEAMGRHVGVEASVNTSLNVGAPMAYTPEDAVDTLRRARGMHGLVLVGADGQGWLAWLDGTLAGGELEAWVR